MIAVLDMMEGREDMTDREQYGKRPVSFTAAELAGLGKENIPPELISGTHLIYSSPATLAFNSPGAEGFGVKRAGLAVPGSVMLIVSPGCCGRNTSMISDMPQYHDRFFYLTMNETDIVTGRHLKKIPDAVKEVAGFLEESGKRPEVVMICITCADALLGTDMERVCRRAEETAGLPVRPCYMYALTREGRKPPMVHVRQSVYSLLTPSAKRRNVADLLGFFSPLYDSSELYALLRAAGVKEIHEISRCRNLAEYRKMAEANFALVLNPEARAAAEDFDKKLGIPSIELTRFYDIERIRKQYRALGAVLGTVFDDDRYYEEAARSIERLKGSGEITFSVGECLNADSFELSLALAGYGFTIKEIFGTLTADNFVYLRRLAQISPDTRVYSNLHPSMIYYESDDCGMTGQGCALSDHASGRHDDGGITGRHIALGKDAGFYHPKAPCISWNSDVQPYGYDGVRRLAEEILRAIGRRLIKEEPIS